MSTSENIQAVDEPQAVVESEEAAAAPAQPGRAFSGHGSLRESDRSIEASATLEQYALLDADGAFVADIKLSFEALAIEILKVEGYQPETLDKEVFDAYLADKLFALTKSLIDRRITASRQARRNPAVAEAQGFIGQVSLDLNPADGQRYQDRCHPDVPAVLFYAIKPNTQLWTPERRAMAVWFTPEVDEQGYAVNPGVGNNGQLWSDDTYADGYHGVVRFFPSVHAAHEAFSALRGAVRVINTPETADEPDAFNRQMGEEQELQDKAAHVSRQTQARRVVQGF